jgi:hypothetical protein
MLYFSDSDAALEEFSQTIMSLEWEIKTETIQTARNQAGALKDALHGRTGPAVAELLDLIAVLLSTMKDKPDLLPSVPTALKRAAEFLKESFQSQDMDKVLSSIEELKTLVNEEANLQVEHADKPAAAENGTSDNEDAEGAGTREESGKSISSGETALQVEPEPDMEITEAEDDMEELSLEPEPEFSSEEVTDENIADEEEIKQETGAAALHMQETYKINADCVDEKKEYTRSPYYYLLLYYIRGILHSRQGPAWTSRHGLYHALH